MGTLHLHPTCRIFADGHKPACPICKAEILPMQAVDLTFSEDGTTYIIRHEECRIRMEYEGKQP